MDWNCSFTTGAALFRIHSGFILNAFWWIYDICNFIRGPGGLRQDLISFIQDAHGFMRTYIFIQDAPCFSEDLSSLIPDRSRRIQGMSSLIQDLSSGIQDHSSLMEDLISFTEDENEFLEDLQCSTLVSRLFQDLSNLILDGSILRHDLRSCIRDVSSFIQD